MLPYKRSYTASAIILSVLVVLSVIGGFGSGFYDFYFAIIAIAIALVALFPMFLKGGILANLRLSISIAAILAIATGSMVASAFLEFVQTGGGEGPKGEGSPLANMIAIAFGAAIFFCPWLHTTLRGIPHWNNQKQA